MSNVKDETGFLGRQALKKSRTAALRKRMREFVDEHERPADFKRLRQQVTAGDQLSSVVDRERDERV